MPLNETYAKVFFNLLSVSKLYCITAAHLMFNLLEGKRSELTGAFVNVHEQGNSVECCRTVQHNMPTVNI